MAEPAWTTSTLTKEVKARMWLNTVGIRNPGALQTSLRPPIPTPPHLTANSGMILRPSLFAGEARTGEGGKPTKQFLPIE